MQLNPPAVRRYRIMAIEFHWLDRLPDWFAFHFDAESAADLTRAEPAAKVTR